jgi:hypothetical protein
MRKCGAYGAVCRSVQDVATLIHNAMYCSHKDPHIYGGVYCDICGKLVPR